MPLDPIYTGRMVTTSHAEAEQTPEVDAQEPYMTSSVTRKRVPTMQSGWGFQASSPEPTPTPHATPPPGVPQQAPPPEPALPKITTDSRETKARPASGMGRAKQAAEEQARKEQEEAKAKNKQSSGSLFAGLFGAKGRPQGVRYY